MAPESCDIEAQASRSNEQPTGLESVKATMSDSDETTSKSDNDKEKNMKKNEEDEEEKKEVESLPPSIGKLLYLGVNEFPIIFVAIILMITAELANLATPLIIANAYDALVDPDLSDVNGEIGKYMSTALIVHALATFGGFIRGSMLGTAGERIVARVRNRLYKSILSQEIAFFDTHNSGELVSRLGSDTTLLQSSISTSMPEALVSVIRVLVGMALMFWISVPLAGLTIGSITAVFVMTVPFGITIGKLSKAYQDILGEAQTRSTEALGAMRTVQSFAAEEREQQRYKEKVGNPDDFACWFPSTGGEKTTYSVGFYKSIANSGFFTFMFGMGFAVMYGMLWYGFRLVTDGSISLGQLTAFQSYIFQIGFGLAGASGHLSQVLTALGASGRIFYLLERIPAIPKRPEILSTSSDTKGGNSTSPPPPQGLKPDSMIGDIQFNDVTFCYPTRPNNPVLNEFTLTVPRNTTAALVGSSGAGKSTVVSLLQRFYDIDQGQITIDGNDIQSLDLPWLRRHIGFVQQEPQLFGLTVKENILYGLVDRDSVSMEELESVCREANAHEFITKFPKGYDTLVGERGVQLSGGQKQRLAIARALLTNCRILLLDEATSALDAESEHLVQEAIDKVVEGRTVIIVAHRLSTIRRASQIVVMDNHRIIDVGSHAQLLGRCEKYQDLIQRQQMMHDHSSSNEGDIKLSPMQMKKIEEGNNLEDGIFSA